MWQSQRPGISVVPRPSMICALLGTRTDALGPTAVIVPVRLEPDPTGVTTTVWSVRKRTASASKMRTLVNATGVAGTVVNDLARPGATAATAFAWASSITFCERTYASGIQSSPGVNAN